MNCKWEGPVARNFNAGSVAIHCNGQTISILSHINYIIKGIDEDIYKVADNMNLGGINEGGDQASELQASVVFEAGLQQELWQG